MSFTLHIILALTAIYMFASSNSEVANTPIGFNSSTKDRIPLRKSVRHLVRRSYVTDKSKLWPNGVVPYVMDTALSSEQKSKIEEAIQTLYSHTDGCITWVPRTIERDFVYINLHSDDSTCNSLVGCIGGKQTINLGNYCFDQSTIIHEMMHALGFIHEHQRLDRDCYVRVNKEKLDDSSDLDNVYTVDAGTSVDFPYDFNSIMHYNYEGSNRAITTKDKRPFGPNKDGKLSELDIWKLNHLYCGVPSYCEVYRKTCWYRNRKRQYCMKRKETRKLKINLS